MFEEEAKAVAGADVAAMAHRNFARAQRKGRGQTPGAGGHMAGSSASFCHFRNCVEPLPDCSNSLFNCRWLSSCTTRSSGSDRLFATHAGIHLNHNNAYE